MKHMTVAVTGAAGIIGTRLVQQLLFHGYAVHAFVHSPLPAGHPLLQEHVTVTIMDFATTSQQDITRCIHALHPLALFHCAAWVDVRGCERDPARAFLINTTLTQTLAWACATIHTHFIFLSTEYVFDGSLPAHQSYRENDQVHPLNVYGHNKVQAESAIQEVCSSSPWTICRTAVLYGSTAQSRPDFPQWLCRQLEKGSTVRIATDLLSSPTYAFDLVKILVDIFRYRLEGTYHTAGSTVLGRYQFALLVARTFHLDTALIQPIRAAELGEPRPLNVGLCVEKISRDLRRAPLSVEEGLSSYRALEMSSHSFSKSA